MFYGQDGVGRAVGSVLSHVCQKVQSTARLTGEPSSSSLNVSFMTFRKLETGLTSSFFQ